MGPWADRLVQSEVHCGKSEIALHGLLGWPTLCQFRLAWAHRIWTDGGRHSRARVAGNGRELPGDFRERFIRIDAAWWVPRTEELKKVFQSAGAIVPK